MHRSPVTRVAGSAAAWTLFATALTMFCLAALWLSAEGSCASGGPYVVRNECDANVAWLFPVGPMTCLVAVVLGMVLAGGFGTQLVAWFWPLMFLSIGGTFLGGLATPGSTVVEVLCGLMALALGGLPLLLLHKHGLRPSVAGAEALDGTSFDDRPARPLDWVVSLTVCLGACAVGVTLGVASFRAL